MFRQRRKGKRQKPQPKEKMALNVVNLVECPLRNTPQLDHGREFVFLESDDDDDIPSAQPKRKKARRSQKKNLVANDDSYVETVFCNNPSSNRDPSLDSIQALSSSEEYLPGLDLNSDSDCMGPTEHNEPKKKPNTHPAAEKNNEKVAPKMSTNAKVNGSQSLSDWDSDLEDSSNMYSTKNVYGDKFQLVKEKFKSSSFNDESAANDSIFTDDDKDEECTSTNIPATVTTPEIDVSDISIGRVGTTNVMRLQKTLIGKLNAMSNKLQNQDNSLTLNDSIEDLSHETSEDKMDVRICWGAEYIKISANKNGRLLPIYEELAKQYDVSISNILLSFKNDLLTPSRKFSDIGYTIVDTIDGGLVSSNTNEEDESCDMITLKFQNTNRKETLEMSVEKYAKFSAILSQYESKMEVKNIKFQLDGDDISAHATPISLDLEGGECIDVYKC